MERNYNYVYSKLVSEHSDVMGHIAYSIYKKNKIEYIEKKKQEGIALTDAELIPFNDISSTESAIENYNAMARKIMRSFIEGVLSREDIRCKKMAIAKHSVILKRIIEPLYTPFWKNVLAGVIASVIFTLILALLFFIKSFGDLNISLTFQPKAPQATSH
jgi:hypothetical protein